MDLGLIFSGIASEHGIGALLVMLGSHAALPEVAKAFYDYAKGGTFNVSFNFGSSVQELIVRGLGFIAMAWGFGVLGALSQGKHFFPFG